MTGIAATTIAEPRDSAPAEQSSSRLAWGAGLRSPKIVIGLAVFLLFVLVAVVGPYLVGQSPLAVSNQTLQPPSAAHWFGTTQSGQDIFAQMIYGTRTSMFVGLAAAVIAGIIALVIGITAGYLGGYWDDGLSLLSNVFLVLPALPLVVIVAAYLPRTGSLGIILVIALTSWPWGARMLRAQTLSLRRRDFVEAARAIGESTPRILFAEILPNQIAVIASQFLATVVGAILLQASLAFLGLSDVSQWSWGVILYWAQNGSALLAGAWWWFVPPGLAIAVIGTSLALMNFGIDEFINPRLRTAGVATRRSGLAPRGARRTTAALGRVRQRDPDRSPPHGRRGDIVLEVSDLSVTYGSGAAAVRAVSNVTLTLRRGEVLGIAGESGSGKSTLAYAMTRLHRPPAQITSGSVTYTGRDGKQIDLLSLGGNHLRAFRWQEMAMVFQSAMNALNPLLTVGDQIRDVLDAHRNDLSPRQLDQRIADLLTLVGIQAERKNAYPHELSGGMRQRIMIAMALALDPEVIIMDEPTTALDVVIQRQIVRKVLELKDRLGFAVVFITHDLSLLIELSDDIAVMYAGKLAEIAPARDFYERPLHPYSRGLLASFPSVTGPKRILTGIPGSPPDLSAIPAGCAFSARCPNAFDACSSTKPILQHASGSDPRAMVACLLYASDMATDGDRTGR